MRQADQGAERHAPDRTPGHRRANSLQRQIAKVRQAIQAGEIQPSVATIRDCAGCGTARAQSIIAELCQSGELERSATGRVRIAA